MFTDGIRVVMVIAKQLHHHLRGNLAVAPLNQIPQSRASYSCAGDELLSPVRLPVFFRFVMVGVDEHVPYRRDNCVLGVDALDAEQMAPK